MPARYLAIKERFLKEGKSEDEAQERAAKIYNATRKKDEPPLTQNYDAVHKASGRGKK